MSDPLKLTNPGCRLCLGKGIYIHVYDRPGSPPGNQSVKCACVGSYDTLALHFATLTAELAEARGDAANLRKELREMQEDLDLCRGDADVMMNAEIASLRALLLECLAALEPFEQAMKRIEYYEGEGFDGPLYAEPFGGDLLRELINGINGEPLTVQKDLRHAASIAAKTRKGLE